jgi:F-type H+-transporting ATPase subunit delta
MVGSVAKRYARAIVELASEEKKLEPIIKDLEEFLKLLDDQPLFEAALVEPVGTVGDRLAILKKVIKDNKFEKLSYNFLLLVMEKDRMVHFRGIYEHIQKMSDHLAGQTRVQVKSAKPLDKDAVDRIRKKLEEVTDRKVIVETEVDSSLIAGVITKLGDYMLDGSLRTQLENIKETIRKG